MKDKTKKELLMLIFNHKWEQACGFKNDKLRIKDLSQIQNEVIQPSDPRNEMI